MANLKSSKKDIIRSERNRKRNVDVKSKVKTGVKKALEAVATQSEEKVTLVKTALRTIDKAAAKGIIHKKTAARKKSRLAKAANKIAAKEAPKTTKPAKAAKPKATKTTKAKA